MQHFYIYAPLKYGTRESSKQTRSSLLTSTSWCAFYQVLLERYKSLLKRNLLHLGVISVSIGVTTLEARDDTRFVRGKTSIFPVLFYFTISESESTPFVFVLGFLYFCTQSPLSNLALAECQVGIVTFFPEKTVFISLH